MVKRHLILGSIDEH